MGFTTYALLLPEDQAFIALLTNSAIEGRAPESFAFRITALTLGKPYQEPVAITLEDKAIVPLIGVYVNAENEERYISRDGKRLFSQRAGGSKNEIFPESEAKFFPKVVDAQIEFVKDASGKVTGIILYQGGQKLQAKKIK